MQTEDRLQVSRTPRSKPRFGVGELVEVRSEREILATLDEQGRFEALPFMPEMLKFAGKRFRVYKRAIKACDTIGNTGMHRMDNAVHLEDTRCDGQAHGGCQAACLLYWKEAWLKPVQDDASLDPTEVAAAPVVDDGRLGAPVCTLATLARATRAETADPNEEVFSCQATAMPEAAPIHLAGWDPRQYARDVTSGNVALLPMLRALLIHLFNKLQWANQRFLPRLLLIKGGRRYPFLEGKVEGKTPKEILDLQPGELVEVKSEEEILQTLDRQNRNRGLRFGGGMLKYCGKRFRVRHRVERIIDERTGRLVRLPGDCIVLDDVVCTAEYELFCPRSIYSFWREIWLRRVEE